jgi:oligoendopeptidase F
MKKQNIAFTLIFVLTLLLSSSVFGQLKRSEIDDEFKWNLNDIFESKEAWTAAKDKLVAELPKIEDYKGKLTKSATDLLSCMDFLSNTRKEAIKLFIYANMHSDLDTRDMQYTGMKQELQQIFSDFSAKSAFIDPELLTVDYSVYEGFFADEPKLKVYEKFLKDLFRQQEHSLSEGEERILALSDMVTGAPSTIFGTFYNAEMPNPEVTLSTGETVTLSNAGYSKYRATDNRADRKLVFSAFWENFENFQATYGEFLNAEVKTALFYSKARNYNSTLEASLSPNDIPIDVYKTLVKNVNDNLPAFHRYLKIKKRMMGLDTLEYIDLYAPAVKGVELKYTYKEAQELILDALQPLGEDYVSTVKKAFDERWLDVYPTPGKRSGAYSNGSFYDGHPYMLLNYNGLYDDVSTAAHELGHTMQSYYSNKNQPYPLSDYSIFVAEVASTFNEVLLFEKMMKTIKDDDVKLSLLMERLNGFKGTLFRQTQFAEFELKIHEMAEAGKPLTGEALSDIYYDIVKRYYGHNEGVCKVNDYIHMEWAYIPHFYYNFYVYQYSTSFVASNTLAERVLNKEKRALDNYLAFLSSGGSDYPIQQLKDAGVDMTSSEAFGKTIEAMNRVMDQIEEILDKKGM